ncbi:MAG: type III-B CRISPR module RAMP protein Cmr1 [Anaerolineae bacterium]
MAKRELIATLEIVTPMFLAGANNQEPELRPPSVRGQLRYWLRAALGAVVGNDLESLKQAEAEVFGDTNGAGAVSIRISPLNLQVDKFNPLPHKEKMSPFWGFKAGQTFEIRLIQRVPRETTWLAAISALLLMVSFGGLGRRYRRGWGTMKITKIDISKKPNYPKKFRETRSNRLIQIPLLDFAGNVAIPQLCQSLNLGTGHMSSGAEVSHQFLNLRSLFINDNKGQKWQTYQAAIASFGEDEHRWLQANPNLVKSVGYMMAVMASPLWLRVLPVPSKNRQTQYILLVTT